MNNYVLHSRPRQWRRVLDYPRGIGRAGLGECPERTTVYYLAEHRI